MLNSQIFRRAMFCQLLIMVCLSLGCREHPQVTSRESLEFIKQVYTACNTRNAQRLSACKSKLDELVAQGQLSEAEQKSFRGILSSAEAGQWKPRSAVVCSLLAIKCVESDKK